jgi:hypothetical protein
MRIPNGICREALEFLLHSSDGANVRDAPSPYSRFWDTYTPLRRGYSLPVSRSACMWVYRWSTSNIHWDAGTQIWLPRFFFKGATHVARSYHAARAAQFYHGSSWFSGLGIRICIRRLEFNSQRRGQFFLFIFPVIISIKQANKKKIIPVGLNVRP